jgi:hypothetical protein
MPTFTARRRALLFAIAALLGVGAVGGAIALQARAGGTHRAMGAAAAAAGLIALLWILCARARGSAPAGGREECAAVAALSLLAVCFGMAVLMAVGIAGLAMIMVGGPLMILLSGIVHLLLEQR